MTLITSTWTGNGLDRNVKWYDPTWWSQNAVPDQSTVAVIPTGYLLNFGYGSVTPLMTVAELDVGGTIEITGGGYLTASTEDAADGASGLLVFAGGSVNFTGVGGTLELQGGIENSGTIDFGATLTDSVLFWNTTTATIGTNLTLDDFFAGDVLEVSVSSWNGQYGYDPATHVLSLGNDGAVSLAYTNGYRDYTTSDFSVANNSGTLTVTDTYPCFLSGTRIATVGGDVPVEELRLGDRVVSAFGGTVMVTWLGHRRLDCRRHPRPHDVWPVHIAPGAFAPNRPRRDLWLSPDHSVFVDGVLIPVRYLLNDATIRQEPAAEVTYWHVEAPMHDVLFAEGLPAESYLDTGNRGAFANAGTAVMLHPDFALRVWQAESCARLVCEGAELTAVRAALLARAQALGHVITEDADLRLDLDGRVIRPRSTGHVHRFRLPKAGARGRLRSLSAVPALVFADAMDHRRLGVAVSRIALDGQAIMLADARLGAGWDAAESNAAGDCWRWTNGDAAIELGGARILEIEVAITARYWLEGKHAGVLAA
jgi:hypothetical protein